jgi:hypothetical protein
MSWYRAPLRDLRPNITSCHNVAVWNLWSCFLEAPSLMRGHDVVVEVTLRLAVDQSVCLGVGHPFGAHYQILFFNFFCRKIALFFVFGRPLWREDGSVICSEICQWSDLQGTHNHILLSHLRLLGCLSVTCYDSQGLWWKYSYPLPQGEEDTTGNPRYIYLQQGPHREYRFQQLIHCRVHVCCDYRMTVTEPWPSNGRV